MLRHRGFHPVRQDHRIQPRVVVYRLLQQFRSISHKQPRLFPLPAGGEQPADLLQQRILSGCNPYFCHSFCTDFTVSLLPSTTITSFSTNR